MNKIAVESDVRKEKSSFVNETNDREAYPKRWVAALVHTNCEKKVATKFLFVSLKRKKMNFVDCRS